MSSIVEIISIFPQVSFQHFSLHVLVVFSPLCITQFMISHFPSKIGIATLVALFFGIPFPSCILWQSFFSTLIPTSQLARIFSALTSVSPSAFPIFKYVNASIISFLFQLFPLKCQHQQFHPIHSLHSLFLTYVYSKVLLYPSYCDKVFNNFLECTFLQQLLCFLSSFF